jgi:hypothetical protein
MTNSDDYRQLVAVHSPRFGTGIKRINSYRQQWLRRRKARLEALQADDHGGKRLPLSPTKSLEAHPGQTEEQADGQ